MIGIDSLLLSSMSIYCESLAPMLLTLPVLFGEKVTYLKKPDRWQVAFADFITFVAEVAATAGSENIVFY